jgi:hypothetical protein
MNTLIINTLAQASSNEIAEGMRWYRDANNYCSAVANRYSLPLPKVVAMLAALSPRNRWERNKQDLVSVIVHREAATVATFGAMKRKALSILSAPLGTDYRAFLTSNKILSFYENILHYNVPNRVTVDVWMGRMFNLEPSKNYEQIESILREYAASMSVHPHQLQAILWVVVRRLHAADSNLHLVFGTRHLPRMKRGNEAVVNIEIND